MLFFFSFGITPVGGLSVGVLQPGQSVDAPLVLATTGPVQRMDPLNNLQVFTYPYFYFFYISNQWWE